MVGVRRFGYILARWQSSVLLFSETSMAYRLTKDESVADGVRRMAAEQMTKAIEALSGQSEPTDTSVHEARKATKRMRALTRLVRRELGEEVYGRENQCYRDAGNRLSGLRDATVLVNSLKKLVVHLGSRAPRSRFGPVADWLQERRRLAYSQTAVVGRAIPEVLEELRAARERGTSWPLKEEGWAGLQVGLRQTYARGSREFEAAYWLPDDEVFHDWRKRVKYLWYHVQILRDSSPLGMQALEHELDGLGELLGEDHDLAVLRETVATEFPRARATSTVQALMRRIDEVRQQLRARARILGRRIYAEPPKAFCRRMASYWETWHEEQEMGEDWQYGKRTGERGVSKQGDVSKPGGKSKRGRERSVQSSRGKASSATTRIGKAPANVHPKKEAIAVPKREVETTERKGTLAKIDFVDAHVHYYDMQHPVLHYGHWQPGVPHPFLGEQIQKLAERNYLAEDYIAETRSANVTMAVHVQAAIGTEDPVAETAWLQEAGERTGFPHAIVAHADLRNANVEATIERHLAHSRMKGIRDFSHGDFLTASDFHRGFALLEKYGLVSSMPLQWQEMEKLRDLAGKFPNIPIIIDHAGMPTERTDEYFDNWRKGMATAAEAENVICKISGLGMGDNNWTVDSIRPYVLYCIETFTPSRSLFATNWPVDWLFSGYDAVVDAYTAITSNFSDGEKEALFSKNTEALYRI